MTLRGGVGTPRNYGFMAPGPSVSMRIAGTSWVTTLGEGPLTPQWCSEPAFVSVVGFIYEVLIQVLKGVYSGFSVWQFAELVGWQAK